MPRTPGIGANASLLFHPTLTGPHSRTRGIIALSGLFSGVSMDKHALHAFMSRSRYGVGASLADDGRPQSALVGVAITPELEIIFDTVKTSRKYGNLIAHP